MCCCLGPMDVKCAAGVVELNNYQVLHSYLEPLVPSTTSALQISNRLSQPEHVRRALSELQDRVAQNPPSRMCRKCKLDAYILYTPCPQRTNIAYRIC
jgi:hypothetical protein